jgi:hypothetical protein
MSRKKLRKALKDPNTVHQVRLSDGRVVEWTGNDDSPLLELARVLADGGAVRAPW